MRALHKENHLIERIGWLRAAVLGANDGLISTSSLIVGVAAATAASHEILVAGVAGLVAGAMSMAAGEYVSVSSQADTEEADMARERRELATQPEAELAELAAIYEQRGVTPELARQVAEQMMAKDAFGAHARDELGLTSHVIGEASSSGFHFGGHLRIWRDFAAGRRSPVAGLDRHLDRLHCLPHRTWRSRSDRRSRWRRQHMETHSSGRVLGSSRHGLNCDHWCPHRSSRLVRGALYFLIDFALDICIAAEWDFLRCIPAVPNHTCRGLQD